MDPKKKERLEADGWTVGSVEDLFGLSDLQLAYVDMTIYLAEEIKQIRKSRGLTQTALANMMGSSQSRIAKLERADSSVSFDLMIRALIKLDVSPQHLAMMIYDSTLGEYEGGPESEIKQSVGIPSVGDYILTSSQRREVQEKLGTKTTEPNQIRRALEALRGFKVEPELPDKLIDFLAPAEEEQKE